MSNSELPLSTESEQSTGDFAFVLSLIQEASGWMYKVACDAFEATPQGYFYWAALAILCTFILGKMTATRGMQLVDETVEEVVSKSNE